jgi:hypothetical protein
MLPPGLVDWSMKEVAVTKPPPVKFDGIGKLDPLAMIVCSSPTEWPFGSGIVMTDPGP